MTKPPSPRPLSVKIISALFTIVGLYVLGGGAVLAIAGRVLLSSWVGWVFLAVLSLGLAYLAIGIGLWRLSNTARKGAIWLLCLNIAIQIGSSLFMISFSTQFLVLAVFNGSLSGAINGVAIWFLIKRKAAFSKPPLDMTKPPSPHPLRIKVITLLFLVVGLLLVWFAIRASLPPVHIAETIPCLDQPSGYGPNSLAYPDFYERDSPVHKAVILHRRHLNCADDSPYEPAMKGKEEQVIILHTPEKTYCNYICRSRKQEQCYDDGSFDTYYDEWCEDKFGNNIEGTDRNRNLKL